MCDFVQIFVSDDDALLQIVQNLIPALTPQHIIMAHSTVAPHSMQSAAEIVEGRGARFLEAPFTGSKVAAEKGELVYYVGGDEAALRDARPILEASSKLIVEIGNIGQATAIKVATNMVTAATVQAAAEAMALVQSAGLPLEKFVSAMQGNASNSTTLTMKLPKILEGDFQPHFSLKHMLKDMQIAARYGLSQHLELSVTSAARDRLLEQMQKGYGEEDYSAVARKYLSTAKPAGGDVADLELFEKPAPPVEPYPFTAHASPEAKPLQPGDASTEEALPSNATPELVPEIGAANTAELAPEPIPVMQSVSNQAGSVMEEAPSPSEEELPEGNEPRRGLFSRLLRRTDY